MYTYFTYQIRLNKFWVGLWTTYYLPNVYRGLALRNYDDRDVKLVIQFVPVTRWEFMEIYPHVPYKLSRTGAQLVRQAGRDHFTSYVPCVMFIFYVLVLEVAVLCQFSQVALFADKIICACGRLFSLHTQRRRRRSCRHRTANRQSRLFL